SPPDCEGLLTEYGTSEGALPIRNSLLNAYVKMPADAVSDSLYLPGITRSITLLDDREQQEDIRLLAATYAALGDYETAEDYLGDIDEIDDESEDFVDYYSVLICAGKDGRDAYHLTALEFASLESLMDHTTSIADQVRVLDHVLNGVYHPLAVEPDEEE